MSLENRALTPDEQLRVLSRIWGNDRDGYVFLPWIDGTANDAEARRKNYHEGRAYRWPQEKTSIREHLSSHEGDDVYFAPSLFNGKRRIETYAEAERALWADLDPVNPRGLGKRKPTIAWESSPGRFQGVWLLSSLRQGASWANNENHRLTVEIGADPSGWDTTQLLRVPGRLNWKPDHRKADGSPVPGKLLWLDGPRYVWSDFDDLPHIVRSENGGEDPDLLDEDFLKNIDRHAVWARVRLKVSKPVREYMASRSTDGADRSDVLWQIERDLADAGCTLAEIVAIVRHTVWNKYEGRNDELKRLKVEAAKALAEVSQGVGEVLEGVVEQKPGITWLSDIIEAGIPRPKWLVRGIWAKGTCGFVSGAPKSYKSWLSLDLAVSIATGLPFLEVAQHPVVTGPRPVLMLLEEDDTRLVLNRLAQILEAKAPELFWYGQLHRESNGSVSWIGPTRQIPLALHISTGFTASDEGWQAWLDETMSEGQFAMVVIDTLGTTAGDVDTDRASDLMTRMLRPLKTLSQKHDCAMAIVHHNKKGDQVKRGGQNMLGSVALHAWVENAIYVVNKESATNGSTTIYVERESKQAPDLQFRVTIPLMGVNADESRMLWRPEMSPGWGVHNDEGDVPPQNAESSQTSSRSQRTSRVKRPTWVYAMQQMSPKGVSTQHLADTEGCSLAQMRKKVRTAIQQGWVKQEGDRIVLTDKGRE